MAIVFHKESRCFHLYNNEVSYIIRIMKNEQLEQLYYGKKIHDREDFTYLHEECMRSQMSVCVPEPGILSMQYTKQEFPTYGTGDYRSPALTIVQENGSRIVNFTYASHEIYNGKKDILPLPATYVENEDEAQTLEVTLHDAVMDTDLILSYTIYEDYPVITRNAKICHKGSEKIVLDKIMSASVEFNDMDYEMVHLSGGWARERYVKTRRLEMVNKDSDLYRAHPDWIISAPERFESHARHQFVLDFSKKEVVDYIYEMVAKVIRESSISYMKWDMNRYMTEPYSKGTEPSQQGKVMHKYILGVYDLYTRLTTEFPEILFESCASGGARFDPAMLYFAPQTWTSDDTDASERTKIQYGTSYVYPIVSMGSHVSAVPNHQLYRTTPIETRANVAYFGTFGYELDLNLLSDAEMASVKKQIAFMKEYRELIQVDGDFYRLLNPFEGNETAWMVVSQDKTQAVAALYQRLNKVNASWLRLKLEGLDPDAKYQVSCDLTPSSSFDTELAKRYGYDTVGNQVKTYEAYGDELMRAGIPVDRQDLNKKGGDFASLLYTIKKVD